MKSFRRVRSKKNKTKNRKRRGGAATNEFRLFKIVNNSGKLDLDKTKQFVFKFLGELNLNVKEQLISNINRKLDFLLQPLEENNQKNAINKRDHFISEFGLLYSNRSNYIVNRQKELLLKIL
jgi:hypothetical protein